ncbi:MAG TPA: hypothetical protein VGK74_03105 [Symbiobacteriaceae bacterium]|jgi:hypothetical protein
MIDRLGSGSLNVNDVKGDLTVQKKSSGHLGDHSLLFVGKL